jgi:hypothetical protein
LINIEERLLHSHHGMQHIQIDKSFEFFLHSAGPHPVRAFY